MFGLIENGTFLEPWSKYIIFYWIIFLVSLFHKNESEILPFPNKELDFILPEKDFAEIKESSFPRLKPQKQDTDKLEAKTEKTDKHEKQDKSEKLEKQDKHDKGDSGKIWIWIFI